MVERHKDKRELFTTEQIIAVLEANGGIIVYAAQKLGVHRNTLSRWVDAEPELKEAATGVMETLLDVAESNLITRLRDKEWDATKFYLSTKGRARGYGIKAEVTGPNGGPVQMAVEDRIDFSKLSTEEIKEWLRIKRKAKPDDEATAPGGE